MFLERTSWACECELGWSKTPLQHYPDAAACKSTMSRVSLDRPSQPVFTSQFRGFVVGVLRLKFKKTNKQKNVAQPGKYEQSLKVIRGITSLTCTIPPPCFYSIYLSGVQHQDRDTSISLDRQQTAWEVCCSCFCVIFGGGGAGGELKQKTLVKSEALKTFITIPTNAVELTMSKRLSSVVSINSW